MGFSDLWSTLNICITMELFADIAWTFPNTGKILLMTWNGQIWSKISKKRTIHTKFTGFDVHFDYVMYCVLFIWLTVCLEDLADRIGPKLLELQIHILEIFCKHLEKIDKPWNLGKIDKVSNWGDSPTQKTDFVNKIWILTIFEPEFLSSFTELDVPINVLHGSTSCVHCVKVSRNLEQNWIFGKFPTF